MSKRITAVLVIALGLTLVMSGCGGKEFPNPIDQFVKRHMNDSNYTLILYDMEVDGTFFKSYHHKYQLVLPGKGDAAPTTNVGPWQEVSEEYYQKHKNDLGMTIAYKKDGVLEKQVTPPGYQYVGDSRYGEWRTHNGSTFWSFYGRYMFYSQLFGMINRPVYRREYDEYRGGYYGSRPYYGRDKTGSPRYGTRSKMTQKERPDFFQRRSQSRGSSRRFGSRGSGFGK
ncbi:MAG: hypothetical protein ACFB10_11810 [Salibacteraceae bacterium]